MLRERLDARDYRLVVAAAAIIAASAVYVKRNYSAAFPEASIDLKLSKAEITARASAFLAGQGLKTEGFRNLTLFDPDDDARLFLERELGLDEANRLMSGSVPVWRWRARWFRPPDKEEMRVWLAPDGRLVGFEHVIAEEAPGARLKPEAAQALAAKFLERQTGLPHKLVEARVEERPNRHDHLFTWEQEDLRIKDARNRRRVVVQGDRIGKYEEFLHVPEQWRRDFAALRSKNELYTQIAQAFYVPLILAAAGVLIHFARRRQVPWRPLLWIAAAVGALMMATQTNNMPFFIDRMPTSASYREALGIGLFLAIGAGVGVFFYVALAAAAGEPLYRAARPGGLTLKELPTARGLQSREFFRATVAGYAFAAAHIAFLVAFYLIGRRFGVWTPQDIEYSDLLSTSLPWLYPLTISLLAATSEEFWFRLFAVPLLKKWLRSTWIAVLIPAFVWGFLHANYPQQPGFIRGIEVGVIGVAAGFLMLRCGIAATLVWHYTVDAVLIGTYLLRADSLYFRLSGVLVAGAVLVPFLASLTAYRRRGGFLALGQPLEEKAPDAPPAAEAQPEQRSALAPHLAARWLYIAAGTALVAAVLLWPRPYGGFVKLTMTRERAAAAAEAEMRSRGADLAGWRRAAEFVSNLRVQEFEYLRRLAGPEAANRTMSERSLQGLWLTRFFKPQQKEEWRVWIGQDGRAVRVDHILDEKAAGARLPENEARRRAADYLLRAQSIHAENLQLVEANEEKRDNRTDHTFVWEDPAFRIGEARARVSVEIVGDEPSTFRKFIKLPEQWLREFERPRIVGFLLPGAAGAAGFALLIAVLRRLSRHVYHWRAYLVPALAVLALSAAASLNAWPRFWTRYPTETPAADYAVQYWLGRAMAALLISAAVFAGLLALDVFRQLFSGLRPLPPPDPLRALAAAALCFGAAGLFAGLWQHIPGPRFTLPLADFPGAGSLLPGVDIVCRSFARAILLLAGAGSALLAAAGYCSERQRWIIAGGAAALVAVSRAQNIAQGAFLALAVLAGFLLLKLAAATCSADLIGFGVALFWMDSAESALALLNQPEPFFRWNGAGALAAAAGVGLLAIRYSKKGSPGLR